jgi:replicative DNA helicase
MAMRHVSDGGPRASASPTYDRVPPHNVEAEESVLGSMLMSKDAIAEVLELLHEEDFYRPAHRTVFRSVLELYSHGQAVDAITVAEGLRRGGELADVGGAPFLHTLVSSVPTAANAAFYARIVKEAGILRRLIDVGTRIVQLGYETPQDIEHAVDEAESLVYRVAQGRVTEDYQSLREVLTSTLESIERLHEDHRELTGVPSGFAELDRLTSGFQNSNLVIVAARPAVGKSTLGLDIARHAAVKASVPTVVFSLEMSKTELVQRLMCAECSVDMQRLRTGRMEDSDWNRLTRSLGKLAEAPLFIDDSAAITMMEIRAKCRRLRQRHGLGLVVIDYLQLMQSSRRVENRQQEVSEISRSLKLLAKELEVPVIAIAQLSRQPEARSDKKPMLSDLRESGCLTADSRVLRADTGAEVSLGELLLRGERNIPVWSLDDDMKLVAKTMTHVFPSGVKPVFELRLASGRRVKATANHPFRTLDGWQALDRLTVGSRVATPRVCYEPIAPKPWPEAEIVMLAHLLGDGCFPSGRPIPYTSTDPVNLDAVARAAAHSGITPRSIAQETWTHVHPPSPHHLTHGKRSPVAAWPVRTATALEDRRPHRPPAASEIFWDTVVAIEPLGEEPVYDATVPGTNNFIANGMVVHNSLEQDADVVLFIYRDEIYDPESPRKGEADLIIAKHRNGPTDSVTVTFQGQYSRFAPMAARSL